MSTTKMELAEVTLSGQATLTRQGIVRFTATEKTDNQFVLSRKTTRMGRMEYFRTGDSLFVPAQLLRQRRLASTREKIHQKGCLRIEMTTRSFLVHVKLPRDMGNSEIEETLDTEMENALREIVKVKEENENIIDEGGK